MEGELRRFENKNVVVTGAGGGIGRAIVTSFLNEGATVLGLDSKPGSLEGLTSQVRSQSLHVAITDLRDPDACKAAVRRSLDVLGMVHVLVNCAGIAYRVPVLEITVEQWNDVIATNLSGAFFMSQEMAKHMVSRGGGAIVNICSVDAFIAESPFAGYNASKAGLVQLTKSMAFELGHLGLRCNGVAPGFTMTPMMDYATDEATYGLYMGVIPMRRYATPAEQASVVLFLASDESSYVNGVTIRVDGGMLHGFWSDPSLVPPIPPKPATEGS